MRTGRLEAFSDGVFAIIITIMVLELHAPKESTLAALRPLIPVFLSYVLSFVYVGIYWNNHHHTFQITEKINGIGLIANLLVLFWLSLIPFVTHWLGSTGFAAWPTFAYGTVLLFSGLSYVLLTHILIRHAGPESCLAEAIGDDRKGKLSMLMYALGMSISLWKPWLANVVYAGVTLMWFVPDPRIERLVENAAKTKRNDGG